MTELIFGTCPRCGEQYSLTSEHVCYHRVADPVARMYHCSQCHGDYPAGQSHGCVSAEVEVVSLLRLILSEMMTIHEEVEAMRAYLMRRWGL